MKPTIFTILAIISFACACVLMYNFIGTWLVYISIAMLGITLLFVIAAVDSSKKRDEIAKRVSDIFKEDKE